jgi:hypothetical protein
MVHKERFPSELVSSVVKYYPMLSKDKLESELSVVYRNDTFANVTSVFALWNLVKENNLENTLSEVHKLVEIVLTPPVSTAESERCSSTLKRVKTYLRNSMGQEHLNALAEYPQGCNCRHSKIQPESNRVVCISEKSKRAVSL